MAKKMKPKPKTKSKNKNDDDGTEIYDDDDDEEEWVEDETAAAAPSAAALAGTNQEVNPDEPVYGTPEETTDLPEPDRSEPPLRPEEQEPEPAGSDVSPNQAFNVKAGSFPEDRPDHDKPLKDKGKVD